MEKLNVIIQRGEDGMYLAIPEHNYNVGLHGHGKTAQAAIEDLKTVCNEAKEFCPELPDFVLNINF